MEIAFESARAMRGRTGACGAVIPTSGRLARGGGGGRRRRARRSGDETRARAVREASSDAFDR